MPTASMHSRTITSRSIGRCRFTSHAAKGTYIAGGLLAVHIVYDRIDDDLASCAVLVIYGREIYVFANKRGRSLEIEARQEIR